MVEREWPDVADGVPRPEPVRGPGEAGQERQVTDGQHPASRVAVGSGIAAELLEVVVVDGQTRLLHQLAGSRVEEVLVWSHESTGQCWFIEERWCRTLHEQHAEPIVADGENHQVDRYREKVATHRISP